MKPKYWVFTAFVILLVIAFTYILVVRSDTQNASAVKIDENVENFEARTLEDEAFTKQNMQGIQIYEVFASWCIPCRKSVPVVLDFQKENPNVAVIGVSYRDVDFEIQKFMDEYGSFDTTLKSSGNVEKALGITNVPQTIFVKDSVIKYRIFGDINSELLKETLSLVERESLSS